VSLDTIFLQTRIDTHFHGSVGDDLMQGDAQRLALWTGYGPALVIDREPIRGVHPVERLVRATVCVDGNASVGFHHDQANGFGKMGGESAVVVDGATGNHESHCADPNRAWGHDRRFKGGFVIPGRCTSVTCSPSSVEATCTRLRQQPPSRSNAMVELFGT